MSKRGSIDGILGGAPERHRGRSGALSKMFRGASGGLTEGQRHRGAESTG